MKMLKITLAPCSQANEKMVRTLKIDPWTIGIIFKHFVCPKMLLIASEKSSYTPPLMRL